MIQTKELAKVYTTEEVETSALNNVSVDINEGEFVAIMGPSGCGKSTLLNVLGLLDKPSGVNTTSMKRKCRVTTNLRGQIYVNTTLVSFFRAST